MRKNPKPYLLILGGKQMGYYKTRPLAMEEANKINTNRVRSSGEKLQALSIKIYYEPDDAPQTLIHEE